MILDDAFCSSQAAVHLAIATYNQDVNTVWNGIPVPLQQIEKHKQIAHELETAFRLVQMDLFCKIRCPIRRKICLDAMENRAQHADRLLAHLDEMFEKAKEVGERITIPAQQRVP